MRELDNILSAALDKIAQIKDSYSIERRLPGGCDYVDQDFSSTSRQNSPVLDRTKNRYVSILLSLYFLLCLFLF